METKRLTLIAGLVVVAGTLAACGPHRYSQEERAEYAAWMVERVSHQLELDDGQQAKLETLKTRLMAAHSEAMKQRDAHRSELLSLLSQPTLDRTRTEALITGHTRAIETQSPELIAAAGDFYDSLNPEQQKKLRERIESRLNGHWH